MTTAVACLDPETIAAYLDRRLDPAERARVEEHLVDCEECRTLLSETALFLEADAAAKPAVAARSSRRPWIWSMAAAAAVLLALTPLVLQRMRPTPESALEELDRALAGKRYVESRLSGFEYGAFVSATRGPSTRLDDLPLSAVAAAGKVEELTGASDTPESLASLGASQLAIGRVDKAVENLEDAARIAPKDARIQSDLAAAYLARFRAGDYPEDPAKAVEAAATAVALDPQSRAAAFNRALALEALPLRGEALRAWDAYLALDPSSGWANEARAHVEELKRPLPPPPPSPSAMLDELESNVFPAWGRAVLASRDTEAREVLARARSLALQIREIDEDRLAVDALAAIDAASPARRISLARAHVLVGEGRKAYLDGRFLEADRAFAGAFHLLRDGLSPYADWALMRRSTSLFQLQNLAESREVVTRVVASATGVVATLRGRAYRMRGLLSVRAGALGPSLAEYRIALSALAHDPTGDDAVVLRFLLGENLDLLGEHADSWTQLRAGLQGLEGIRDTRQRQARFFETATYALRQGLPRTALALLAALRHDRAQPLAHRTLAECLLHQARIIGHLGDPEEALRILGASATLLARAESVANVPRLRMEWVAAQGEILSVASPGRAVDALTSLLPEFDSDDSRWRLASLYLALGRAHAALGELSAADRAFRSGILIAEEQLSPIDVEQTRVSFFARSGELFAERLSVAVRQNSSAAISFALSEEAKGRSLRDRLAIGTAPVDLDTVRGRLPPRTVLISFSVLADQLLVWKADQVDSEAWSEPVSRADLSALVATLARDIRRRRMPSPAAHQLYDLLLRRALASSAQIDTVIVAPDAFLHSVPFAALADRQAGRYAIQDVTIIITPSATLFVSPTRSPTRPSPSGSVLVVAPSSFPDGPMVTGTPLPFSVLEAQSLAALYGRTTLLLGADATKQAFLDAANHASVIHFAGHAMPNARSPFLSRMVFSDLAGAPGSGELFAYEVSSAQFPSTELVVLGACSTGSGPNYPGEGPISLARPFLAAGVPAVIASLWDVDDRIAREQLTALHRNLAQGGTAAMALRNTQLAMLEGSDESLAQPSAWAAFEIFATRSSSGLGG